MPRSSAKALLRKLSDTQVFWPSFQNRKNTLSSEARTTLPKLEKVHHFRSFNTCLTWSNQLSLLLCGFDFRNAHAKPCKFQHDIATSSAFMGTTCGYPQFGRFTSHFLLMGVVPWQITMANSRRWLITPLTMVSFQLLTGTPTCQQLRLTKLGTFHGCCACGLGLKIRLSFCQSPEPQRAWSPSPSSSAPTTTWVCHKWRCPSTNQ